MKITVQKTFDNKMIPCYSSDIDSLKKMKVGEHFFAEIKKPRNIKHHRKFFTLIRLVFDNLPEQYEKQFPDKTYLLNEYKYQTGNVTEHRTLGGKITYIPKSISFASMDQIEFEEFYEKCIDITLRYFFKGTDKDELKKAVIEKY